MKLKKGKFLGALLLSVFLLSSCKALRNKNALFTSPTDNITDSLKTVYVVNDGGAQEIFYRIKPADLLTIRNLQNVEFGAQHGVPPIAGGNPPSFYVEQDGTVLLPGVGKVSLGGLTRREAISKLQNLYSEKLLKDPIIELSIINLKVNVLGEVKVQGKYFLENDNTTLVDIISVAGGLTPLSNPKNIKIIRGNKDNPEIIYVNLSDLKSLGNNKLVLRNNDIIYAEPRRSSQEAIQNTIAVIQPFVILLNVVTLIYALR